MAEPGDISIRRARDDDAPGLINLIGAIFKDYDSCSLDLDNLDRELLGIETAMKAGGGKFWVATRAGRIVGSIGYTVAGGGVELKRLYVAAECRRAGLANRLANLVYSAAEAAGARTISLWSDTRFVEAHAFYLKHGFEMQPKTRDLNDPSHSVEFQFIKKLG